MIDPVQDARLDLNRRRRLGMVEAIWGEHKTADQIINILEGFSEAGELGLVTRVDPDKAAAVLCRLPVVRCIRKPAASALGRFLSPLRGRQR